MEGACMHAFPRTVLDQPVELQIGGSIISNENPDNNLSVGGLFVSQADLPVGAPVHIRIRFAADSVVEADGQIRDTEHHVAGCGIAFTSLSSVNREALYELIADLTRRGLPAA
jgi:hypothetical protein